MSLCLPGIPLDPNSQGKQLLNAALFSCHDLAKEQGKGLVQAAFWIQRHSACAEAALLIPFPNMLMGACGEQNLGVSSLSPDLGLKLKVCVQ